MKKIVGIIAAVAMAASVFAVDFSGALIAEGSLFNLSFKEDSKPTVLNNGLRGWGGVWYGTRFQTIVDVDKAGIQFACTPGGNFQGSKLWVQPIDMLKVTLISADDTLWAGFGTGVLTDAQKKVISVAGAWQFTLTPMDGLTVNLTLGNDWIKNGAIGATGLSVKYGADFGTLGFMFVADAGTEAKGKVEAADGELDLESDPIGATADGEPVWKIKKMPVDAADAVDAKNFKKLHLGAGYSNKFGDLDMFANVALDLNTDSDTNGDTALQAVKVGAQAAYAKDALSVKGYAYYGLNNVALKAWNDLDSDVKKAMKDGGVKPAAIINELWLAASLEYALDACTPYVEVSTTDLIINYDYDPLKIELKPGVKFNIGAASCNVGADFILFAGEGKLDSKAKSKGSLNIPFDVTVGF